jgi:hypothetical protein
MDKINNNFFRAIKDNFLKILRKLYTKYPNEWSIDNYILSIKNGDIKLIKWLYNHNMRINPYLTFNKALLYGHTNIVDFVINNCNDSICIHDNAFIECCKQNNLELYLYLRKYGTPNPGVFDKCIKISTLPLLINRLNEDLNNIDIYNNIIDGIQGIRRPNGCKGSHSLCIGD